MKIRRIAVFAAVITLAAAPCAFAAEEAPAQTDAAAVTEESFVTQAETSKEETTAETAENAEETNVNGETKAPEAVEPQPEEFPEGDTDIPEEELVWIPLEDCPIGDPDRIIDLDEEYTEEPDPEPISQETDSKLIEAEETVYYVELSFDEDETVDTTKNDEADACTTDLSDEEIIEDEPTAVAEAETAQLVTISDSETPASDEDGAQEPVGAVFAISALLASAVRFLLNSGIF